MHEVLVNRLGGLSLSRKSVVRLTDRPDMTLDVYRGRKTTIQQQLRHFLLNTKTWPLGRFECTGIPQTTHFYPLVCMEFKNFLDMRKILKPVFWL